MDIVNTILTVIISIGFTMTILEIKNAFTKEANDISDGLDLLDLEARIEALESGIKAHTENIRVLSGQITKLQTETIDLKNQINNISRETNNIGTSLNNLTPFVDLTRGIAEDNKKRLDNLNK
jgi:chromosome segregation ATPase